MGVGLYIRLAALGGEGVWAGGVHRGVSRFTKKGGLLRVRRYGVDRRMRATR